MNDDAELLDRFARRRDQAAFRAWVDWRLPLVYSVAWRSLEGDAHLAEDVAQLVFADAARQAGRLARHASISGWLFTSTRYTAAKLVRTRRRTAEREQTAAMDPALTPDPVDWNALRPVLDEALEQLPPADRDAVIERFFNQTDYPALGRRLDLSANAARMRVDRALEKLSQHLSRHGIRSTATALGATLGAHGLMATPAGLAATVSAGALAGTGGLGAALTFLAAQKLPLALSAAVVAVGTGALSIPSATTTTATGPATVALAARPAAPAAPPPAPAGPADLPVPVAATVAGLDQEAAALRTRLAELDLRVAERLGRAPLRGKVHELAQLDRKPAPRRQGQPVYPTELRNAGQTGRAVIEFTIDETGQVRDLATIEASHPQFADAALAAIATWEFNPGEIAGRPVNTRLQVPMEFKISQAAPRQVTADDWF